jgi:hypothetical protein
MTKLLEPKVKASGFIDLVAIGVVKKIEESLTAPIIGNGTLKSGAIKGVAAGFLDGKGGRIGHVISGALAVDAGEDLAIGLMGLAGGAGIGGAASPANEWA